jgi:hypothetical protein
MIESTKEITILALNNASNALSFLADAKIKDEELLYAIQNNYSQMLIGLEPFIKTRDSLVKNFFESIKSPDGTEEDKERYETEKRAAESEIGEKLTKIAKETTFKTNVISVRLLDLLNWVELNGKQAASINWMIEPPPPPKKKMDQETDQE